MDTEIVPYQPGVLLREGQLSGVSSKHSFLSFNPSLNLLKIHLNSGVSPPKRTPKTAEHIF